VANKEELCPCPRHFPDWDDKDVDLAGQCVHIMPIAAFIKMPLSFETYLKKQSINVDELGLKELWPNFVLTRTKMWGGEIIRFLEDSDSPSRMVQYLPPPFTVHGLMHHGGIGTVTKSVQTQQVKLIEQGRRVQELYMAHLTCPRCEEERGGEKILLVRRWVASKALQSRVKKMKKPANTEATSQ